MDASTDDTKSAEEGRATTSAAASTTPEYNSSSVKKARLESTLAALLTDPILADVPKKPLLSDADTLINLELGSAMRLTVLKLDGTSFGTYIFCYTFSQTPCGSFFSVLILIFAQIVEALISVYRFLDGEDVAVMNTATLKDLKLAVKKKVNEMEESKMGHRQISWYDTNLNTQ